MLALLSDMIHRNVGKLLPNFFARNLRTTKMTIFVSLMHCLLTQHSVQHYSICEDVNAANSIKTATFMALTAVQLKNDVYLVAAPSVSLTLTDVLYDLLRL
jgi:hypothetical protein